MAYYMEPGHIAMCMLTPEQVIRMYHTQGPNLWPVYFGAKVAMQAIQDIASNAMVAGDIDALKDHLEDALSAGFTTASYQAAQGPTGNAAWLKDWIIHFQKGLYDNWKAGVWKGVGGAYSSAMDNLLNVGQLIYAYKTLMYHTAITPRMRRHWNMQFTPMEPDTGMAYILYRRGQYNYAQFVTHAMYDGWPKASADLLLAAMELLPSPREAFYLWKKDLITRDARDQLYTAAGLDSRWHGIYTDNWYWTPSVYDLTRMADYVEMDQIWVTKQLRRSGVRDSDIPKIWEMLERRTVNYEINGLTAKWVWRMRFGRATLEDLEEAFIDLGVRRKKRELLLEKAQLDYEDELVDEWVEILQWRFRTAVITEKQFLEGLLDLGIREEKANLIVELEKAKGYYGYY